MIWFENLTQQQKDDGWECVEIMIDAPPEIQQQYIDRFQTFPEEKQQFLRDFIYNIVKEAKKERSK